MVVPPPPPAAFVSSMWPLTSWAWLLLSRRTPSPSFDEDFADADAADDDEEENSPGSLNRRTAVRPLDELATRITPPWSTWSLPRISPLIDVTTFFHENSSPSCSNRRVSSPAGVSSIDRPQNLDLTSASPEKVQPRPSAAAATTVGWWTTFSAKKRKPLSGLTSSKVSDSKGLKGFRVRSGVLPEYALTANAATFRSLSTDRGGSAAASSSSSEYSISSATFCSADSGSLK